MLTINPGPVSGNVINAEKINNTQHLIETAYKRYSLYEYGDTEFLCEPYTVKKGDWIYKIFRTKGELSNADFPLFLNVFQKINPDIKNMDNIQPGQVMLIPLKRVQAHDFNESVPGIVDVPIIKLSKLPEKLNKFIKPHLVQNGDNVSNLLDPSFMHKDGSITSKGNFAFKLVNPDSDSLDLIFEDTTINLPLPSILEQPWFEPLMLNSAIEQKLTHATNSLTPRTDVEPIITSPSTDDTPVGESNAHADIEVSPTTGSTSPEPLPLTYLQDLADINHGKLMTMGKYYFPGDQGRDVVLDLQSTPLIRLKDGTRILFVPDKKEFSPLLESIGYFWQGVIIMEFNEIREQSRLNSSMDLLALEKAGQEEAEPGKTTVHKKRSQKSIRKKSILMKKQLNLLPVDEKIYVPIKIRIPRHHRFAVQKLLAAAGYNYTPETEIEISLPMEPVTITAKPGLIIGEGKPDTLIFFGDIYGTALESFKKKSQSHIITMPPMEPTFEIIKKLFTALDASVTLNPAFVYAENGKTITIPGIFIKHSKQDIFISESPMILKEAFNYLSQKNIKITALSR